MAKSKPNTVRFNEEHLQYAMKHFATDSVQKIVDQLMLNFWQSKNKKNDIVVEPKEVKKESKQPEGEKADAIKLMIEFLESEKVPKERDTPMGKKIWQKEQSEKIQEYKSQLLLIK